MIDTDKAKLLDLEKYLYSPPVGSVDNRLIQSLGSLAPPAEINGRSFAAWLEPYAQYAPSVYEPGDFNIFFWITDILGFLHYLYVRAGATDSDITELEARITLRLVETNNDID